MATGVIISVQHPMCPVQMRMDVRICHPTFAHHCLFIEVNYDTIFEEMVNLVLIKLRKYKKVSRKLRKCLVS